MADARIINVDPGDSTNVNCVNHHIGPSGIHVQLSRCLDLESEFKFCLIY